jgi:predicted MFS family arabinose efflux permease
MGITALPASVLFGVLWQRYGAAAAFWFGATLALLAAVLLVPALAPRRSD